LIILTFFVYIAFFRIALFLLISAVSGVKLLIELPERKLRLYCAPFGGHRPAKSLHRHHILQSKFNKLSYLYPLSEWYTNGTQPAYLFCDSQDLTIQTLASVMLSSERVNPKPSLLIEPFIS
jgi:hypothetical protein